MEGQSMDVTVRLPTYEWTSNFLLAKAPNIRSHHPCNHQHSQKCMCVCAVGECQRERKRGFKTKETIPSQDLHGMNCTLLQIYNTVKAWEKVLDLNGNLEKAWTPSALTADKPATITRETTCHKLMGKLLRYQLTEKLIIQK